MRTSSIPRKRSAATHTPSVVASDLINRFDLHQAPGHLLRRCHSRARAIFDELVGRKTGLSKQQVALMIAIAHSPAATHAQLSEETGFDRNTLADTLDRLIGKGLAVRQRSLVDARAYDIQLTSEGLRSLEDLIPLSFEVQAKIIEPVPEELRPELIRCLQILAGISPASESEPLAPRAAKRSVPTGKGSRRPARVGRKDGA
jgi:MarR family transcriptional regulator, lower aerobic nicotinate degradation pathway regulator